MPELPEVETVRRGLTPALEDAEILSAVARRADLRWPLPERFAARLTGRRALRLRRRSKFILVDLDDGATWLLHLGMSGRVSILPHADGPLGSAAAAPLGTYVHAVPSAAPGAVAAEDAGKASREITGDGPHDHVVIETDRARIVYTDARRFGAMDLYPTAQLDGHKWLAKLGPEPLGDAFHADHLAAAFAGRSASVKSRLMDQTVVAGLGNIYVCEALWRAGVRPTRPAGGLSPPRIQRLTEAIRAVLRDAIEAGGSTLRDYRHADGELGRFQQVLGVYGRTGEPCATPGCQGDVRRIVQTGRSSFYCPTCQR